MDYKMYLLSVFQILYTHFIVTEMSEITQCNLFRIYCRKVA